MHRTSALKLSWLQNSRVVGDKLGVAGGRISLLQHEDKYLSRTSQRSSICERLLIRQFSSQVDLAIPRLKSGYKVSHTRLLYEASELNFAVLSSSSRNLDHLQHFSQIECLLNNNYLRP
jgi:hypothetical protein